MKRFKNILYIFSGDEVAEQKTAARVQMLARRNEARVCVVRVLEKNVIDQLSRIISIGESTYPMLAREQLEEELHNFTSAETWKDIDVSAEVLEGRDFIEIIKKVIREEHDLVIKNGVEDSSDDQLAMRLFRKCPCPVWIIRSAKPEGGFKRILAALDLGSSQEENRLLNRKIIELTDSMAKLEGAEAHYIYALHLEFEGMMRGPRFRLSSEEIAGLKQELKKESEKTLHLLFQETGVQAAAEKIHLVEGETSEVIEKAINDLAVDVLIMGTVARSGVPGLLIGNKAEKVLSSVDCTVLAVKPGGYISPINQ